jgi:hypothetical protein
MPRIGTGAVAPLDIDLPEFVTAVAVRVVTLRVDLGAAGAQNVTEARPTCP